MKDHRVTPVKISIFIFFLFIFVDVSASDSCRTEQRDALLEFRKEIEIPNSDGSISGSQEETWNKSRDCCNWEGVSCYAGEVTAINLSSSGLKGRLLPNSTLFKLRFLHALDLSLNQILGRIPSSIAKLPHLKSLNFSQNQLRGQIPSSIGKLSELTSLDLSGNRFRGKVPSSIWKQLPHLTYLDVSSNKLFGQLPSSIVKLHKLTFLSISSNHFCGQLPSSIGKLLNLTSLDFASNDFSGPIPSSLFNISSLEDVRLQNNQFNGSVEFGSSTSKLRWLDISNNSLIGIESSSVYWLSSIEHLDFSKLKVTTTLDLNDVLASSKTLSSLDLSGIPVSVSATTKKGSVSVRYLGLSGCMITSFPEVLRSQQHLVTLDISSNEMNGQVPAWLWNLPNLEFVNVSNNAFTNFGNSENPRVSLRHLFGSHNRFRGEIPSFLCSSFLMTLDLSKNKLSGSIPPCMDSVSILILRHNGLSGALPETLFETLRWLDVGHNKLVGKLPTNVTSSSLEVLNVESNRLYDTFPSWLSRLRQLKVLVLRSNAFHGPIQQASFPELKIIDISHNDFTGTLPSYFFGSWTALSSLGTDRVRPYEDHYYHYSLVLTSKGVEMDLGRMLSIYTAIDFSGNRFGGEIPETIGLLIALRVLNLSKNAFTGRIPSSIGFLTSLESLDVSQNQLSGEIPQELGNLTFVEVMNFSHNHLEGLVPGGSQFLTQSCSSYKGNAGLYGPTLEEVCKEIPPPPEQMQGTQESKEEKERKMLNWMAAGAVMGFLPGIVFGLSAAYLIASYRREWVIQHFGGTAEA